MRKFSFCLLAAAAGLLLALPVAAQRRQTFDLVLSPELQVEVGLQGNDYLLAAVSMAHSTLPVVDNPNGYQARLGYEHFWNAHWSAGATLRVLSNYNLGFGDWSAGLPGVIVPGLLLRHRGQLGKFNFGQRLGAEYMVAFDEYEGGGPPPDRALARLRFDVDRVVALGEKLTIRPRLAYEALAYLRLQREETEQKERVIDFGSLRAEVGLRLGPQFDFTPYVAWQTSYINSLPGYREEVDSNGNTIQISGGRTNLVTPVVGLDLRYTLLPKNASPDRIRLPTQH